MSLPKTGSVTAVAPSGRERDLVRPEQDRLPRRRRASRRWSGRSARTRATRPTPAIGVRSGRSSASKTSVRGSPNGGSAGPSPAAGARGRGLVDRSMMLRRPASPVAGRRAAAGEPEVAEQDHQGERRRPPTNSSACAPSRVQKTPSKPTLAYQIASVQRSIPKVNSTKSAMSAATMTQRPTRRPRRHPGAVVGPARCVAGCGSCCGRRPAAGGRLVLGRRSASSPSSSSDPARSGSPSSGSRRPVTPFGGFGAGRAPRAPALRAGAAPPGSRRTGRASSASLVVSASGPVEDLDGGRNAREDGLGELVGTHRRGRAGSKRNAARIAGRRATAGSGRRAGRASRGGSAAGRRPRGSGRTAPRRSTGRDGPAADPAAARRRGRRRGS